MIKDIRIAISLRGHPKRAKLAMLLGPGATGHMLDLWIATAMSHPDGVLRGKDDLDIAIMANWPGAPQDFTSALLAVRFLGRQADGTYYLHDWDEHQAWVVGSRRRSEQGSRAINARWERRRSQEMDATGPGNAGPVLQKMPEAGSKSGGNIPGEYSENTCSIPGELLKQQTSNTPLPSSPSALQEGIKAPPVAPSGATSPVGGTPQERKRFAAPTVAEVAAYCLERANGLDAEHIHAHYTANGWKVGRNPMRDWKAAVCTWERREKADQAARTARHAASPAARLLAETSGGQAQ